MPKFIQVAILMTTLLCQSRAPDLCAPDGLFALDSAPNKFGTQLWHVTVVQKFGHQARVLFLPPLPFTPFCRAPIMDLSCFFLCPGARVSSPTHWLYDARFPREPSETAELSDTKKKYKNGFGKI